MSNKLELYGTIGDDGAFTLHNRKRFEQWCSENKGKQIKIKFEKRSSTRSLPQNSYYHGVVVQEVRLGLINIGYDMSTDEVHHFLKMKFNPVQVASIQGEVIELPGSTTQLTKTSFGEYIERIAQWAAEYLNVVIPAPSQTLTIDL